MKTVKVQMEVITPKVPNFLHTTDGQTVPLWASDEAGLRAIGEQWTKDLIRRSQEQFKNRNRKD